MKRKIDNMNLDYKRLGLENENLLKKIDNEKIDINKTTINNPIII